MLAALACSALLSALPQAPIPGASSEDPLRSAALEIEAGFAKGDTAPFLAAFDSEALHARAVSGLPAQQGEMLRGVRVSEQLATNIRGAVQKGASYRFLRVRTLEGMQRALFRLVGADSSLNYIELLLTTRAAKVRIDDVYVGLSGEWMSQTLRRAVQLGAAIGNPGIVAKLTGADRDIAANAAAIKEFSDLLAARKLAEALVAYQKMPAVAQENKTFLIGAINAASGDEAAHARLFERFEKLFPEDPALDILSIDYYFNRKDYGKELQRIERLDRTVGGDAYLRWLKAATHRLMGAPALAKEALRSAIALEPSLKNPYWTLIEIELAERDWAGTVATLLAIERDAGMKLGDLQNVAVYAEFVKTREYRDWMKRPRG